MNVGPYVGTDFYISASLCHTGGPERDGLVVPLLRPSPVHTGHQEIIALCINEKTTQRNTSNKDERE